MKRTLWLATAAVALAAVVTIPAAAQQAQAQGPGRGQGMGMGPGGPGGRGGPGGPMQLLRGLQLTDAQREQIRAIHQEARPDQDEPRMGDLQRQLNLALLADAPDVQKVAELKTAIAAAQTEMLARRIDVETRVAQVLTAEQRAKARERLANAPARGPGKAPGRGAGRQGPRR